MKKSLFACIALSSLFVLACEDDDMSNANENNNNGSADQTCVDNSKICLASQKCDQTQKICVAKTCKDEPKVCLASEKCNDDGVCVAKTCKDEPKVCLASEKCNDDGECVAKTCKEDATICKENQTCNNDGQCVDKSCKEDQSICKANEKCNTSGQCEVQSCAERCSKLNCGSDGECYADKTFVTSGSNNTKFVGPVMCENLYIPENIDFYLDAIDAYRGGSNDANKCKAYYDVLKTHYNKDEISKFICSSDPRCGSPEVFAYCEQRYYDMVMDVTLSNSHTYSNTNSRIVDVGTASIISSVGLNENCQATFSD